MKPVSQPHDPLDDLLAAAVHGELTAAQRLELDALLQHDPAARAAYREIQTMHDLLENNHRDLKPAPNFEDRMISGVRRKVREEKTKRESMWESLLFIWRAIKWPIVARPGWSLATLGAICAVAMLVARREGQQVRAVFATINSQLQLAQSAPKEDFKETFVPPASLPAPPPTSSTVLDYQFNSKGSEGSSAASLAVDHAASPRSKELNSQLHLGRARLLAQQGQLTEAMNEFQKSGEAWPGNPALKDSANTFFATQDRKATDLKKVIENQGINYTETAQKGVTLSGYVDNSYTYQFAGAGEKGKPADPSFTGSISYGNQINPQNGTILKNETVNQPVFNLRTRLPAAGPVALAASADKPAPSSPDEGSAPAGTDKSNLHSEAPSDGSAKTTAAPESSLKLVRDATLDLQVKAYQPTVDAITALAKADGGYLDSSNSQRGGNGKLQGTVVAKVAPDKLDAFLLKLRDLGELKNQSVSTEDVTKDYVDTQARIANSQKMETQLQELLKHNTNKVADLLEVERELARVRGEIEQAQGQIKLYDFQVQYATVTITVAEKDLNKTAAYLLQEHDQFALFVHDVEDAFTQAKAAADTYKAQILNANLQHDSGNTMSATMAFSVPPDQVDGFLAKVKALGRVDNFTRTTSRVANDGGNSDQPADETRTDRDNAQVQLTIHADDESPRQQTQVTVASTGDIDAQAQQVKDAAAKSGAAVTASSFERAPDGSETAVITFRLPLARVGDLMPEVQKLGRVESLSVTRNDRPGQAAADPNAPAEIDLRLHNVAAVSFENEQPRQDTEIAIASSGDVDAQAQQLKADALKAGLAVTASTFQRSPDGTEQAAMTFRLPLTQAAAFTETLKKLGRVESLAIQRNDVTGPNSTDPNAPAEINLNLHSEPAVVAADRGVWPTLRNLFGGGVSAFLGSVETIGVLVAFIAPWVVAGIALLYVGRRVWVMRKSRA